jgi:hypothetical protein
MELQFSPGRTAVLAFLAVAPLLRADDASLRTEIQAAYDRTIRGQLVAKTPEDLDANERLIDTPGWVSIVNDGPPQHWADLQGGAVATLGHAGRHRHQDSEADWFFSPCSFLGVDFNLLSM